MEFIAQTILGLVAVSGVLTLLILAPSPVRIWEAGENFFADRKHARMLIDSRQAAWRAERMPSQQQQPVG